MPKSPPKPCCEPGCSRLVYTGARCEEHSKSKRREYASSPLRRQLTDFYNSNIWKLLSKDYRRRNPICVSCASKGRTTPTDLVDHIIPVRKNWELRLTVSNLQPLCHSCHNKKTAAER